MGEVLYLIFLYPFEYFFRLIIDVGMSFLQPWQTLILLSLVVNAIYIPVSIWAQKIEQKERIKQSAVSKDVKEIKKLYKGEEAFRKIEAVYKKHNYNILLSFRANLSLLIMIPFFAAAVITLNNNPIFVEKSFFYIKDLSKQDALINGINLLPFLMTAVNILSIKYTDRTKNLFDKDNIKLLVLSLLFLVFLYNKSSALVFYWTLNNVIYLVRVIIKNYKTRNVS